MRDERDGRAPGVGALASLTWPLYLELWLTVGVGLVGTTLAARDSAASVAAFSLGQQVAAMLFLLFRVVGAGVSVVVSQRLGNGQPLAADRVARASVGASTWLGALVGLPALFMPDALLHGMNAPADVLGPAAQFLRWIAPVLLLDAWNACMASVLRARLRPRDALAIIVATQALALLLALVFMRGFGPVPPMGLTGYALALLLARALGVVLHLAAWRWRLDLRVAAHDFWRLRRPELRAVLHVGLPGAAENVAWRLCFMATLGMAAQMGTQALATHGIVLQLMHCVMLFSAAIGLATEIVVGHLVGRHALHGALALVRRSLAWGLAISTSLAAIMALAGPWLLRLFTEDPTILATGATLLWWTVWVESGRAFNLIVINGLRAAGDTRFPLYSGAASMVLIMAGGGWWLGVGLGWGLVGLWIAYGADEWLRGLIMWWRWTRLGWLGAARRAHRALRALREQPAR